MSIDWAKYKTAGFDSWKSSKDMQAGQPLKVFSPKSAVSFLGTDLHDRAGI